jgi:hypothetical protein
VLDLIWEVSKSAHRDSLLWWVLRIAIALSFVGNDHLRVRFGSESSRLEKWLLVPDASLIDVKPGMDVIDCVDNEIKALPEFIVEGCLSVRPNPSHIVLNIKVLVHSLCNGASALRLRVPNVLLSEQELSVEVGNLNIVIVSAVDLSIWRASDTHESECLDKLASKSSRAYHEQFHLG